MLGRRCGPVMSFKKAAKADTVLDLTRIKKLSKKAKSKNVSCSK